MAKFTSVFPELGFYVKDQRRKFSNGFYITDDKDEIAVLENLAYAVKVSEPTDKVQTPAKEDPKKRSKSGK